MNDATKAKLLEMFNHYGNLARCTTEVYTQYIQDADDDDVSEEDKAEYEACLDAESDYEKAFKAFLDTL